MNRRLIVHLSTVHHPRDNRITNKEVPALREAGIETVLMLCSAEPLPDLAPLVTLPPPSGRLQRLTVTQARAWRALSRLRPALVHIHDPELIPLAWLWTWTHRARWIYDAHEDIVSQAGTKTYLKGWQRRAAQAYARVLTGLADRYADAVVAATQPVAALFARARTVTVRNYPRLSEYAHVAEPVPGRLIYVGDLSRERKLDFMIALTASVRREVPEAHLVLVGRTLPDAEALVAGLAEPDQALGLVPPARVPELLATADAGLVFLAPLPNYLDSEPTKLFEYMAAGVPFVASDFPRWRETFDQLDAGVLVPDDVASAARQVADLLRDREGREALGRRGREQTQARFNFAREAEQLVELSRQLLDAR